MALTINHPDANILAQELISYTGETLIQAVLNALRERIKREKEKHFAQRRTVRNWKTVCSIAGVRQSLPRRNFGLQRKGNDFSKTDL